MTLEMSLTQEESVIKNIIREIRQECAANGNSVSETLVAFIVKAVVLDPKNEFNEDRALTKRDVRELVELCVGKLMEKCSPSFDTIQMQVYFDMNYTSRREFIKEHHRVLTSRLCPVSREITDNRAMTQVELEELYSAIIGYVLLRSGVGSPSDVNTVREATAALQSVFPQAELGTFLALAETDKEQQLGELTAIVTGIRLFNKFTSEGGEGVDDLPVILNRALPAASGGIKSSLRETQSLAWRYTALLERSSRHQGHAQSSSPAPALLREATPPPCSSSPAPALLREALYNVRQHEALLKVILADLALCARQAEALQSDLASRMTALRDAVQPKMAVATARVFPHFVALATLWSGLQDEMVLLNILDTLAANLQPFLGAQSQLFPAERLAELLEDMEVKSDAERITESSDERIEPNEVNDQQWFFPETADILNTFPLQYRGMCGHALVNKDGLLLPGNPSVGVLKHRERFYIFSSKEAAVKFASGPEEFIGRVAEKARSCPELIHLLALHRQFPCATEAATDGNPPEKSVVTRRQSGTQTNTHLLETNLVSTYEWNEWELRRKAVQLANLRGRVTHSMETHLSHLRRDSSTQVYLPKDTASQTKRDGQTNVPRPQVYLAGLRGNRTGPFMKTNLTREI